MNDTAATSRLYWPLPYRPPFMVRTYAPLSVSHSLSTLSAPQLTRSLPSAFQLTPRTCAVWPVKTRSGAPVVASKILTKRSADAVASRWPSGEKRTPKIVSAWASAMVESRAIGDVPDLEFAGACRGTAAGGEPLAVAAEVEGQDAIDKQ